MANIIIVGGGVAGLSAGIYARLCGHCATIYERHFIAGGNLTGWNRQGYHIDNCIHWLTGTNPLTKLYKTWQELGVLGDGIEVMQGEALFNFEKDGVRLSLGQSLEALKNDMLSISPEDKKETLSFIKAVRAFQHINGTAGENNDKRSTALQKVAAVPALAGYYGLSTGELAARFKHPVIKGLFESLMTDYFSALALVMVFATFTSGDGGIPRGSSCGMADRMTKKFLALGGCLKLRTGVEKINIANGEAESVTLDDGSTDRADYVIVAIDPAVAFGNLLDRSLMPKMLRKQYEDAKMQRFSSYHCAMSCDMSELPFVGDMVMEVSDDVKKDIPSKYFMLREFSHEESFAPEGKNILQAMIYCKEDEALDFISLKEDKEAYKQKKESIASAVINTVCEKFPEMKEKLACLDVWTPATYKRYVGSEIGSWMSFALPPKTAPKRISNEIKGLRNVVLATQWLQSPGGLPIAAASGINAVKAVVRRDRKRRAAAEA